MKTFDKELLEKIEKDYSRRVYNGEIAKQMTKLFKARKIAWSPFKMGYFCAVLRGKI